MADSTIGRMRVGLNWDRGGPGVCTFHFTTGVGGSTNDWGQASEEFYDEMAGAWGLMKGTFIPSLRYELEPTIDLIDVASGNITDQLTVTNPLATGNGTAPTEISTRAQQCFVGFLTDVWRNGRRLRGGVYMGPAAAQALNADGEVASTTRVNLENSYGALISGVGPRLAVYHRPRKGESGTGYYGDVVRINAKQVPAILRSRRD